jgi:aminodeoxyfutalosine deaminase
MNRPINFDSGSPATFRLDVAAIADERGIILAPASVLVRTEPGGSFSVRILPPAEADRIPQTAGQEIRRIDLRDSVLIPGLVNAHTHLDLTAVGPFEGGRGDFPRFLGHVVKHRPAEEGAIRASVHRGIELSLAGGVVAVGDIAGCPPSGPSTVPFEELAASNLAGVSFIEYFGIGRGDVERAAKASEILAGCCARATRNVRPGISPHAPYTVSLAAYRRTVADAARLGALVCTHLAESQAEREFIAGGKGPHRQLLERFGLWHDGLESEYSAGRTPIEHMAPALAGSSTLVVHCNDVSDADFERLAGPVAYCPRSSSYFQAEMAFGPHRYRDMLSAGINVCLGTDSIINLPNEAADAARGGISVLDEARFLYRRDSTDPAMLLGMMTTRGARALGLPAAEFRFGEVGLECSPRGLVAVRVGGGTGDRLNRVISGSGVPELLFLRTSYG